MTVFVTGVILVTTTWTGVEALQRKGSHRERHQQCNMNLEQDVRKWGRRDYFTHPTALMSPT